MCTIGDLKRDMLLRNYWYLKDKLPMVEWDGDLNLALEIREELKRIEKKMEEYKNIP